MERKRNSPLLLLVLCIGALAVVGAFALFGPRQKQENAPISPQDKALHSKILMLHSAVEAGNLKRFEEAIAEIPEEKLIRDNLLTQAVINDRVEILRRLLDRKGWEQEAAKVPGLLDTAAGLGYTKCLSLLIERGADVNRYNNQGRPPLMYAVSTGHTDAAKILLDSGANINAPLKTGDPPRSPNARIIKENERALSPLEEGSSPLVVAVQRGHPKCVQLLLERKADVTLKTVAGQTALSIAQKYEDAASIALLEKAGAK